MGKCVKAAAGEKLQRQRKVFRLTLRLLQHFLPEPAQSRHVAAALVILVNCGGTAVDDRFLLCADALFVKLFKQGQHKLGLVNDRVPAIAIAFHHVHRIDVVTAPRRYADDLAAHRFNQGTVLSFGIAYQNIVPCGKGKEHNQHFCAEGLAAPRHS